ncbi:hypothetical protein LEMLEM_LOCUS13210 [Lemmus lemmus]
MSPQRSSDRLKQSETAEEVAGLPDEDKMPGQTGRMERKSESLLDSNSNTHQKHTAFTIKPCRRSLEIDSVVSRTLLQVQILKDTRFDKWAISVIVCAHHRLQ